MKLLKNTGSDRVIDELQRNLASQVCLDIATPDFSLFAFGELQQALSQVQACRLAIPTTTELTLLGGPADRAFRNRLQARWLARQCAAWIAKQVEVRQAPSQIPQTVWVVGRDRTPPAAVILGNCSLTTEGLGITPGNQLSLIQASESPQESALLAQWFTSIWNSLPAGESAKQALLSQLSTLIEHRAPAQIYNLVLYHIFKDLGEELDEEKVVKSATGIRNTQVWQKLFKFQRDGVIGAIDKLERYGGCIIADSVGLGKTFEALAIIKYYELRNDRVLVLAPKRLRDNWSIYRANDRRNTLAADRFNYDVLNHTDLSRDQGLSGDIDLTHINWGNYDLVVIDESHNFRNKRTFKGKESRYDRLMRQIIKEGVKTRVLMLSATPVNNRLADLKNQIAFITEGQDKALHEQGIASIEATVRRAQQEFNSWQKLSEKERVPARLLDMLGFDYFKLLDLLTIARSRKHIEKYYGTEETGAFPERLKPVNIKADVDAQGEFPAIRTINNQIRMLNLSVYAPLRYVLPHKQVEYDAKYSTKIRGGETIFRQADREESLVQLMRVNVLKRMESAVSSFALTLERQLADVEATLAKLEAHETTFDEFSIEDIDVDDPAFESLLVGRKVRVLLQDTDLFRWRQDLREDRDRLAKLLAAAKQVVPERDAKLLALKELIAQKAASPLNPGYHKVIIFSAFADTVTYLYTEIAPWARRELGLHTAMVTGTGSNKSTLPKLRSDLGSILTAFSPRSKERPPEFEREGTLDLLIATDCISEGQNLQDCDTLVNYDIHWNPVRIIQRFGRIDRIGSPNSRIQLINFWPNIELDEYINLEQRVSGRMVLLDISATGEENIIEQQSGNQMNDLEYRRKQLFKLQETVIDLEDLSSGLSIADLTLTDFRIDLGNYLKQRPGQLEQLPLGAFAVTTTEDAEAIPPGAIFCLQGVSSTSRESSEPGYPLAPYYLVHVSEDGATLLPFSQAKAVLDRLKKITLGQERPLQAVTEQFDRQTRQGKEMAKIQNLLAEAVASIAGKKRERALASLFSLGGTHSQAGEFAGINDFEVLAFLVVLPEDTQR